MCILLFKLQIICTKTASVCPFGIFEFRLHNYLLIANIPQRIMHGLEELNVPGAIDHEKNNNYDMSKSKFMSLDMQLIFLK